MNNDEQIKQRLVGDLEEMYQKRLHSMTYTKAAASMLAASQVLGDNDYLSAEFELRLIADWLKRQFTPDEKTLAVRGTIIGALAGGHMDSKNGASYSKAVLANIADALDIEIPADIKAANGLH